VKLAASKAPPRQHHKRAARADSKGVMSVVFSKNEKDEKPERVVAFWGQTALYSALVK
jgi:hypothetical protein